MRILIVAIVLGGCGATPQPPPTAPVPSASPEPEPAPVALPPREEPSAAEEHCEPDHAWDAAAHACRLFPGGGYGWAGCSQAKAPPNAEACFTGTHWQECDCRCDAADTRWNPGSKRCE